MTKNNQMIIDDPLCPQPNETAISVEQSRAIQEVQAAVIMAKKFPRNEIAAYNRIIEACKRVGLAKQANYSYPKGKDDDGNPKMVTGASIRMAETLAKYWGNIQFGIVELSNQNGSSEVMAYAWDLETNTRQVKQFNVKHIRYTKNGSYKLTDPRDIYEVVANQGARRLRACILGVIPDDVLQAALKECRKTLAGDKSEPIGDKIRRCVAEFSQFSVSQAMLEAKLGHKIEVTVADELVDLLGIWNSLKDKMSKVEDHFERPKVEAPAATEEDAEAVNEAQKKLFNKTN